MLGLSNKCLYFENALSQNYHIHAIRLQYARIYLKYTRKKASLSSLTPKILSLILGNASNSLFNFYERDQIRLNSFQDLFDVKIKFDAKLLQCRSLNLVLV